MDTLPVFKTTVAGGASVVYYSDLKVCPIIISESHLIFILCKNEGLFWNLKMMPY